MSEDTMVSITDVEREAFERTAPDRDAVDLVVTPHYNMDAVYAASQAELVSRRIAPYRSILEALPDFDMKHVDRLVDYANALVFIQTTIVSRASRVRKLPHLAEEGYRFRKMLLAYGDVLVLKGVFQAKVISRLRDGSGYRDLVEDLGALVRLYEAHPETIGPDAPVTTEDLQRVAELARTMRTEFGLDQEPDLSQDELLEARRKTAWLLVRAHSQIRRAMSYIRFEEGDAASFVPSLYLVARRRAPSSSQGGTSEEELPHPDLVALHDALHQHQHQHQHELDAPDSPFVDD